MRSLTYRLCEIVSGRQSVTLVVALGPLGDGARATFVHFKFNVVARRKNKRKEKQSNFVLNKLLQYLLMSYSLHCHCHIRSIAMHIRAFITLTIAGIFSIDFFITLNENDLVFLPILLVFFFFYI
jgi:hypothetical protein